MTYFIHSRTAVSRGRFSRPLSNYLKEKTYLLIVGSKLRAYRK